MVSKIISTNGSRSALGSSKLARDLRYFYSARDSSLDHKTTESLKIPRRSSYYNGR